MIKNSQNEKSLRYSVSNGPWISINYFWLRITGVLILQNAKGLFLSQDLARANYQAELAEILHGTFLGDFTWVSRGVF